MLYFNYVGAPLTRAIAATITKGAAPDKQPIGVHRAPTHGMSRTLLAPENYIPKNVHRNGLVDWPECKFSMFRTAASSEWCIAAIDHCSMVAARKACPARWQWHAECLFCGQEQQKLARFYNCARASRCFTSKTLQMPCASAIKRRKPNVWRREGTR